MSEELHGVIEDVFKKAFAKREDAVKQAENAEKNKGGFSGEYEEITYFELLDKQERVFRIFGNPVEVRSIPTDPKLVLQSEIVNEAKSGYSKINWKWLEKDGMPIPDPDWILTKLFNKIKEGKYKNYHANTTVFKVLDGNAKTGERYPKNFYPSKKVVMNVRDKHDDWCKKNKHSKLLSSKVSVWNTFDKDTKEPIEVLFPATGIPKSLYDELFDHAKSRGNWEVDYVVTKVVKKMDYDVWDAGDTRYLGDVGKELASEDVWAKDELAYDLYDLDKLFPVASYHKINKTLGYLFKLCDEELNTNFLDELEELVNDETLMWEQDAKEKEESEGTVETPVETKEEATTTRRQALVEREVSLSDYFPKFSVLPEVDKKQLEDNFIKFKEDGTPEFKSSSNPLTCTNEKCTFPNSTFPTELPEAVGTCPICSTIFTME